MTLAIASWILAVISSVVFYSIIAHIIEKSGEAHLGATGHLFTCDPDRHPKK